jgi:thymidylate kinase
VIRSSYIFAIDGTHASGKTTLIYSVAANLKSRNHNCIVLPEPSRNNPLVDDVVLHNSGSFDLPLELDLIATHITQCVRASRKYPIILSDRTPINVLAYTNLLITLDNPKEKQILNSAEFFTYNLATYYDMVFYCQDYYSQIQANDKMRSKVINIQSEIDIKTREYYKIANINLELIPKGKSLSEKTESVIEKILCIIK